MRLTQSQQPALVHQTSSISVCYYQMRVMRAYSAVQQVLDVRDVGRSIGLVIRPQNSPHRQADLQKQLITTLPKRKTHNQGTIEGSTSEGMGQVAGKYRVPPTLTLRSNNVDEVGEGNDIEAKKAMLSRQSYKIRLLELCRFGHRSFIPTAFQQWPQRLLDARRYALRRDLVSRPVHPDLREATDCFNLVLASLEDTNLVHHRAVTDLDDSQPDIQHTRIVGSAEVVAVAVRHETNMV